MDGEEGWGSKNRNPHHPHLFTYSALKQYEHYTESMQRGIIACREVALLIMCLINELK